MVGAFGRRLIRILTNHVYFNHSCLNESQRLIDSRTTLKMSFWGGPFSEDGWIANRERYRYKQKILVLGKSNA